MTESILAHILVQSVRLVPVLWFSCRCLPRLSPAIRTMWWCDCAQMLSVWLVAVLHYSWRACGFWGHWLTALWGVGVAAWLAARLALRRSLAVRVSPRLKMPVIVGLWRPILLIQKSALEAGVSAELRMALAHELSHLCWRDLWYGLAPVLAQTVLFFHPLVWLAVREYVLSREQACAPKRSLSLERRRTSTA